MQEPSEFLNAIRRNIDDEFVLPEESAQRRLLASQIVGALIVKALDDSLDAAIRSLQAPPLGSLSPEERQLCEDIVVGSAKRLLFQTMSNLDDEMVSVVLLSTDITEEDGLHDQFFNWIDQFSRFAVRGL
jgi:hypothetical protein